jgi:hypothetical protein
VVQLHRRIEKIHAAGAELVVIGNGSPTFMAGFRETTGYAGALYTDPSLEVYKAAGLKRGVFKVLSPRAGLAALGALKGGFRQGRTQGDALQQGGTLVIDRRGDVLWAHVDDFAGDHANPDEILRALDNVRSSAPL